MMSTTQDRQSLARALFAVYDKTSTRAEFVSVACATVDAVDGIDVAVLLMLWECFEEATEAANEYHARQTAARVREAVAATQRIMLTD